MLGLKLNHVSKSGPMALHQGNGIELSMQMCCLLSIKLLQGPYEVIIILSMTQNMLQT